LHENIYFYIRNIDMNEMSIIYYISQADLIF